MKKTLFFVLAITLILITINSALAVPETTPYVYWKLNEISGTTADDAMNIKDGTLVNTPTWTTGKLSGALDFDNVSSEWVNVQMTPDDLGTSWTYTAWFKVVKDFTGYYGFLTGTLDEQGTYDPFFQIAFYNGRAVNDRRISAVWRGDASVSIEGKQTSVDVNDDTWRFLVVTFNGSDMKLYLNGTEQTTTVGTSAAGTLDGDNNIPIGGYNERNVNMFFFDGQLDDVRFYKSVLNETEILQIYNSGSGCEYGSCEPSVVDVVLVSPEDNVHSNSDVSFSFNVSSFLNVDCTLQLENGSGWYDNETTINISSGVNEINSTLVNGNTYSWRINCTDGSVFAVSDNRTIVIDDIFPVWTINSIATDNTTYLIKTVDTEFFFNDSVFDLNLYAYNVTITNTTGNTLYTKQASNINITIVLFNETINISLWNIDYYSINYYAVDAHTYGTLNNLTATINTDGIIFSNGVWSKKIYFGYYMDGEFNFLTPQQINTFNISASVIDTGTGEFKFSMLFKRPVQDILFGFAVPKTNNLVMRNVTIAHMVWANKWYLDFEDLPNSGFPITVKEKNDYWLIYTSTSFCPDPVGEMCELDPVVGGLNVANETYTFSIAAYVPPPPFYCLFTPNPRVGEVQEWVCTLEDVFNETFGCQGLTLSLNNSLLDVYPRPEATEHGFITSIESTPDLAATQYTRVRFSNKRLKINTPTVFSAKCVGDKGSVFTFNRTLSLSSPVLDETPELLLSTKDNVGYILFGILALFVIIFVLSTMFGGKQ